MEQSSVLNFDISDSRTAHTGKASAPAFDHIDIVSPLLKVMCVSSLLETLLRLNLN